MESFLRKILVLRISSIKFRTKNYLILNFILIKHRVCIRQKKYSELTVSCAVLENTPKNCQLCYIGKYSLLIVSRAVLETTSYKRSVVLCLKILLANSRSCCIQYLKILPANGQLYCVCAVLEYPQLTVSCAILENNVLPTISCAALRKNITKGTRN